jgi:hypothetical protein
MTVAIAERTMASEKEPKTLSVRLHMDVIKSARIIAAYQGVQMTDLLSDILRPILARIEKQEVDKRSSSEKQAKGGKP